MLVYETCAQSEMNTYKKHFLKINLMCHTPLSIPIK